MQESHDKTLALYIEELYLTIKDNVKFQRELKILEAKSNEINIPDES